MCQFRCIVALILNLDIVWRYAIYSMTLPLPIYPQKSSQGRVTKLAWKLRSTENALAPGGN